MTTNKFVIALVAAVIYWATTVVNSPSAAITAGEWVQLVVGVATALGVYQVSNTLKTDPAPAALTAADLFPLDAPAPIPPTPAPAPAPPVAQTAP